MILRAKPSYLLIVVTVLLILMFQGSSYADIDIASAFRPYQVSFEDWVLVYLSTQIAVSTDEYSVQVITKHVNKKVRFVVEGYYTDTAAGRRWYQTMGSKIEGLVGLMCKAWTAEGHPITLDDFEIVIRKR